MPAVFPDDIYRRLRALETLLGTGFTDIDGNTTPTTPVTISANTAADANTLIYATQATGNVTADGWYARVLAGDATIDDLGTLTIEESVASQTISGSTATVDFSVARVNKLTLGHNVTLTLTGSVSGRACGLTLYLIQDGTGSRTVTWPGSVKWPSGTAPTLSTAASSVDIVVLESTDGGTTWYGNLAGKGYA